MTNAELARRLVERRRITRQLYGVCDTPPRDSTTEQALLLWLEADAQHRAQALAWLAHSLPTSTRTPSQAPLSWATRDLELRRPIEAALGGGIFGEGSFVTDVGDGEGIVGTTRWFPRPTDLLTGLRHR